MCNVVEGYAVKQEEVVVAVASVNVQAAHEFVARGYAGERLELLDNVGGAENGHSAAQAFAVKVHKTGLGSIAHLIFDRRNPGAVKGVAALHDLRKKSFCRQDDGRNYQD